MLISTIGKHTFLSLLLSFLCLHSIAQVRQLYVMEWNVENLFDTIPNPKTFDDDFTPKGANQWNSKKYWRKLSQISRTITAIDPLHHPDIIVLCEVENDSVLYDLTHRTRLAHLKYKYTITHSADRRGINIGVLYQPLKFRPITINSFRMKKELSPYPTRDILHVSGHLTSGDTLDLFAIHAPSRRGDTHTSNLFRFNINRFLRQKVDSIALLRHEPLIIITGDFNDECRNKSIKYGLGTHKPSLNAKENKLYTLSHYLTSHSFIRGTYKYRDTWNTIDQFIVSGRLLQPSSPYQTNEKSCSILAFPFLLQADKNNSVKPRRTYLGPFYQGGASDHLPLLLKITNNPKHTVSYPFH